MAQNNAKTGGRVKVRALRPGDYPAVREIVAQSFEEHIRRNRGALDEYADEPWYDPNHLLVAELGGQVVSQMGVRDGVLWIDGRPFPAGLLGTVCTRPEYRGRGIGSMMLRASFAWMEEREIAISYLHTSEARYGFYGRQGYRLGVIQQRKAILKQGDVPDGEGIAIRRAGPEDAPACNALYEAYFGCQSGAWSRTGPFWVRRLSGKPKLWFVGIPEFWIAEDGAPLAYLAAVRNPASEIVELAACPKMGGAAARALVSHAMREMDVREMDAAIGPRDPLWPELACFRPEDRSGFGHVLLRVQDREVFARNAEAMLALRAHTAGLSCTVHIAEGGAPVEVGGGSRQVEIAVCLHDLCSLIYNGRRLDALREERTLEILRGSAEDLRLLFPDTAPARCLLDGY